jgi:hemoglobin-like flavoprotein
MSLNVEVLQQSFEQIKPQASEFADSFYQNLFADYPQVQPLFAKTNMVEQKKHLIGALVLTIDNLKQPEILIKALKEMGARHLKYGTIEDHYPMVGGTLLKTFALHLGSAWTEEVKQAWLDAYDAIAQIMLQGAAESNPCS